MKINLECGNNWRNGYLNISSWIPSDIPEDLPEETAIISGQSGNLDPVVEDNSAQEIVFNPPFNIVKPNDILDVLQHWQKKLKDGGILKIYFIDIRLSSRFIYSGELKLQDVHNIIFGANKEYESVIETEIMREVLSAIKFKILSISHKQFFVTIEAQK